MDTFTNPSRSTGTRSNPSTDSSTVTNTTRNIAFDFLLLESGFYLLQEDGVSRLELETTNGAGWKNPTAN